MSRISLDNINCWEDFKSYAEGMPNTKSMGDAFEHLTYLYFKISPKYSFYDEVYKMSEVPNKDLELLKIPQQDLGIDLIAKVGSEYHPIQCKYHTDKKRSVTFNEVSTFLTQLESNPNFNMGYIASTADTTSSNYDKLNTKQVQKLLNNTWLGLERDFFDKAREFEKSNAYSPDPYYPREHQIKAVNNAYTHFIKEKNNRGKLIFPCGAGKSLTGFWMMEKLNAKSTLVAVPSLSLIKQTLDVYLKEVVARNLKVKWLCICSDEGIGKNDDILFRTSEIGVPCTTDKAYIKEWLKTNKKENIIIFTTYQSGRLIAEISKSLKYTFDLGIYDEAHKTVGKNESLFSYLLFEENISIKHRIFMTATERFYRGVRDDVLTMDDPDDYGDVFSHMSFKEAIDKGLLTDYKIVTIEVKKEEIAGFIKDNNLVQMNAKWEKESEARSLASMIALRKAMKAFPIKNAVSFHSSIERAVRNKEVQKHITDTYNYKPIETYHVSGKLPTSKRETIVNEFANSERALITNSRCLTEGVDVPNIDCIVFTDPRKSKVDIVQALGRALRKKDGKDFGYVVLPVIYDHTSHEIDNENFQEILNVVRGLAANDERIIEEFKDKSQNSSRVVGAREEIFRIDPELLNERELVDNLNIKLWEKLSRFNWMPFVEARKYACDLKLRSRTEWEKYTKSNSRNFLIPVNPDTVYKNSGWINWGDFLGTGTIASQLMVYRPFEKAREFVRNLGLKTYLDWQNYCKSGKKPNDIPQSPAIYKGYVSMGDWLGTGRIAYGKRNYLDFEKARKYARSLGLKYLKDWEKHCNSRELPNNIPKTPSYVYKRKGWVSIGDWLGSGIISTRLIENRPFEKARKFARSLNLKSESMWHNYARKKGLPEDIPNYPNQTYKEKGWISFPDFLGYVHPKQDWMEYDNARDYVSRFKFRSYSTFKAYFKNNERPVKLPINPRSAYKNKGWISSFHFLGLPEKTDYINFDKARSIVRKLNISGWKQWKENYSNGLIPKNIPKDPYTVYRSKGWISVDDFFGKAISANNRARLGWEDYETAKEFALKLNHKSGNDWREYIKSNKNLKLNLPATADRVYSNKGWKSWGEFLGYDDKKIEFLDFNDAREYVRKLKIISGEKWKEYCKSGKKPKNIPNSPYNVYKDKGWKSFPDFIGKVHPVQKWLPYQKAREYVVKLNLKNWSEWSEYCKSGKKPINIPNAPKIIYKNKGWKGISDFLGKE